MTFALVNPLGWALFELLTSGQMNQLDFNMTRALDGAAGGVYSPTAQLTIDGATNLTPGSGVLRLVASANAHGLIGEASLTRSAVLVPLLGALASGSDAVPSIDVFGRANTGAGFGAAAFRGRGGNGNFAPGSGGQFFGGNGAVLGAYGGTGVTALGGQPRFLDLFSGAGGYFIGGDSTDGAVNAGSGLVAKGGSNPFQEGGHGLTAEAGDGSAAGVFGRGIGASPLLPAVAFNAGGCFLGSPAGFRNGIGLYVEGSDGVPAAIFQGLTTGVALRLEKGSATDVVVDALGAVNFAPASGVAKNPLSTTIVRNKLYAKNTQKAWGLVRNGVLIDGFNIASVAINGVDTSILDVTMATNMASANYMISCASTRGFGGNNPRWYSAHIGGVIGAFVARTTTFFQLQQIGNGAAPFGTLAWASSECYFTVDGPQS